MTKPFCFAASGRFGGPSRKEFGDGETGPALLGRDQHPIGVSGRIGVETDQIEPVVEPVDYRRSDAIGIVDRRPSCVRERSGDQEAVQSAAAVKVAADDRVLVVDAERLRVASARELQSRKDDFPA